MKGLIPAAGMGTRLAPFTKANPKELFPIDRKAVIDHVIECMNLAFVNNVYIVVGFQKGAILDHLGNSMFDHLNIAYLFQEERKGLGHAILQGEPWIKEEFIVACGDSIIHPKEEIKRLVKLHEKEKPIATLLLFKVKNPSKYGIVKMKDNLIIDLIEKPSEEEAKNFKNNGDHLAITGYYIFKPEIFDYIKKTKPGKKNEIQITDSIKLAVENGEKVAGLVLNGDYLDIGTWETVEQAIKLLGSSS